MTDQDRKIVSLDAHRKQKARQEKQQNRRPEKPARDPSKSSSKAGIFFVLAVVLAAMGLNYLKVKPAENTLAFKVLGDTAFGNGSTDNTSLAYMTGFLKEYPDVTHLVFQNMPGTSDGATNLKIAELIRKRGLSTHIQSDSYIASGAVDLFIAGSERTMECGARIGVHSWRSAPGVDADSLGRDPLKQNHEKFLSNMGVDPAFYSFTQEAAPPQDIYILKMEEITRFGLLTKAANCG